MMPLVLLAAASADLEALEGAVQRCDRNAANPTFAAETERRSRFLLDAFREQEAIVAARLDLAERRRALREAGAKATAETQQLAVEETLIEDRQRALNDQRMLEGIRQQAMDAMRRHYLLHCAAGTNKK